MRLFNKPAKHTPLSQGAIRSTLNGFPFLKKNKKQKIGFVLLIWIKRLLTGVVWVVRQFFWVLGQVFQTLLIKPFTTKRGRYIALFLVLISVVGVLYILKELPSPRNLTARSNYAVSTQIFDRNGVLLYEIFADENRIPIDLVDLPPHVYQAAVSIEDKNFYRHFGFDISGITRAALANLQGGRLEGGSTITQQLVKNALLTRERSITRKIKEVVLAVFTEVIYTKEEILEMYLNYISYGGTSVGIEAAAQSYFDKHAHELSLAEAALLAGLPQAPSTYSPFGSNPVRAKDRQKEVLRRMVEDGYISQEKADAAAEEVLQFSLKSTDIKAPHFVFFVRDLLYEKYGSETVEKGGLRVTTTLDLELHQTVQASVSAEINTLQRHRVSNGAALVIKPNTGEILSMVGSRDYFNATASGQVNVTLAERQPGSSIKPLMYATAFQEKLLNPGTLLLDVPTCFDIPGQKPYCPRNYNGGFSGPVTVRHSLGNSLNIPAVKGLKIIGLAQFISQSQQLGITSWTDPSRYGLSLTLGGGEVRMIDMAQAFAVLANQGVKVPITPFLQVEDFRGKVYETFDPDTAIEQLEYLTLRPYESQTGSLLRVMDRAPAYLTSHIMQDNQARQAAFGSRSELVIPNQIVSVKTGTTNDLKDNWTVGFTPEFLVTTWVGNNDSTPMNPYVVSGVTGAAPIFNDIMQVLLKDRQPVWQEKPSDVASAPVCINGMPPSSSNTCSARGNPELYWVESRPSATTMTRENIWIDPNTGQPPPPGETVDGLVIQERVFYQDPVSQGVCADCTGPEGDDRSQQRQFVPNILPTETPSAEQERTTTSVQIQESSASEQQTTE
jgi:penicillin-binding protein 1C